ncbi:hypothetical protein A3H22_00805 [Candidatus Peribacteria bacterium RIFCSPLOWO2_12_FULL_55_15]|nr:MAG: hypothetical protein A2789_00565 [Candidatus Peribacteria bacterium RIFCSPHIGHO2_01_FULL_54_22]OGJ63552.1 MAG: hypothetical protein A3D12_03840 [Candidatus Peribacteria bacterium RIFCSPHIGHO2_02_FULL_55_24]OGJ63829.1 MAG: hypothetical protein A3E47_01795 [Candidatus Peribacteria bacterium RIFCSPHIGHO2_12_FULL_54_10]OGJ67658.1 MAG: hypothetical protein A2947_00680 [Candidatus Peribacteria bacterium RIFCSPLOWO2_01_FULL_54_110]OGJ69539.1 MAG: hypothetical protein A3H90_02740 [Candidatus Pe
MKENFSLERPGTHASSGNAYPSFIQRTVRTLLAPVLLGGTLAAGAAVPSADVAAQIPIKEERKEEDPVLAQLRQEIFSLIADLDNEKYQVREKAQRRLEQIAIGWVLEKQRVFPLVAALAPKGGYSLEQHRRLGRILDAHEREELGLLWRPTIFREPPEWKERKDSPTAREVLAALGKQTGQNISLDSLPQGLAESAVAEKLDGRTFWEALEQAGKKCMVYRGRDGSLALWGDERCVRAASGNILGQVQVWHCHPYDQMRQICVRLLMEQSLLPGGEFITKADGITDKGRKVACDMEEWNITLPFEDGEQSIDLTVTVVLRGYEKRVETLKNLAKIAKFPVGSYELQILGASKSTDSQSAYWSIEARLLGEDNEYEKQILSNAMQCRAFDADGKPVAVAGFGGSTSSWGWEFRAEPHSIELVLPGRVTTAEKTLVFKGIPLD